MNSGEHDGLEVPNDSYTPMINQSLPRPLTPTMADLQAAELHTGDLTTVDLPPPIGAQGISPYGVSNAPESAEFLLPPKLRPTARAESERSGSPDRWSAAPSSISSLSRDSRFGADPFNDSRGPSRSGSDEYDVNTQTVSEKFNITPSDGLLLFPEDVEKDDYLHNPDPMDKDSDCDLCNRRGLLNVGGLAFLTLGILCLFIGYPVM